jgi:hypothetical protein
MSAGSKIIISGMHGASSQEQQIMSLFDVVMSPFATAGVSGGESGSELICALPVPLDSMPAWMTSGRAAWDDQASSLTMYICPGQEISCRELRFSLTIRNAGAAQSAPAISIEARDTVGNVMIPRVGMDAPQGYSELHAALGVPHGMRALHIEATTVPQGVVVISPSDSLTDLANSPQAPREVWLRPGWYHDPDMHCKSVWTHNVTLRGMSARAEDVVLDCEGLCRHMKFVGSVVASISNMTMVNGKVAGDGGTCSNTTNHK